MQSRSEKIRERLFPGALVFDPTEGGYTSLPYVLRKAQFLFSPRGWQVYTYICMRMGPAGIGWFALDEMGWDLDYRNTSKLKVYVDHLIKDGWVLKERSGSKDYYVVRHPVHVLREYSARGDLAPDRLDAIEELLEAIDWLQLDEPLGPEGTVVAVRKRRTRQRPAPVKTPADSSRLLDELFDTETPNSSE